MVSRLATGKEATQFKPGVSGNPGGRPKSLARQVRELVGDDGQELAEFMLKVVNNRRAGLQTRMQAVTWLADRGWGKAAAYAPVEDGDPLGSNEGQSADEFAARVLRLVDGEAEKPAVSGNGRKPRAR